MPISISPNQLFAKKADGTGYLPANVISGETTETQCARVTAQGTTEVQRVQTKAQEVTSQLANAAEVRDMIAGTFSSSTNYTAGQIVIVTNMTTSVNELWRFTADHSAGDWIGTDAVKIKLANDVSDLKSALVQIEDFVIGKQSVSGSYLGTGVLLENGTYGATSYWGLYVIPVQANQIYDITAYFNQILGSSAAKAICAVYDVNVTSENYTSITTDHVLKVGNVYGGAYGAINAGYQKDDNFIIPENGVSMVISCTSTVVNPRYTVELLNCLQEQISRINGSNVITADNYSSKLPDVNSAPDNSLYIINFAKNQTKPSHLPSNDIAYNMSMLLTLGGTYKVQYLIDRFFAYTRTFTGSSWGEWLLLNRDLYVSVSNYSTRLPDLNDAIEHLSYVLNFLKTDSKPTNIPDSSVAYDMAVLLTFGESYKTQILVDKNHFYKRIYTTTWGSWDLVWDFTQKNLYKYNTGVITSDNYASLLPDLNDAVVGSTYELNFGANGAMPANMPSTDIPYSTAILQTFPGTYPVQILFSTEWLYKRYKSGSTWDAWTLLSVYGKNNVEISANSSNLISRLKRYNGKGVTLKLANGVYDVFTMYKNYYGNDFWDNYAGYSKETDYFKRGLWLKDINLVGCGDVRFTFSGTNVNEAVKQYFAIFAPGGNCSIENMTVDCGSSIMRYAVHDDFAAYNSIVKYKNITFKGTPHEHAIIGAGCQSGVTYVIEDCLFLNNGKDYDIHYHANSNSSYPCRILVSNCYGEKGCGFAWYGTGTEVNKCIVNNSQFGSITVAAHTASPHEVVNMELKKYLCVETAQSN